MNIKTLLLVYKERDEEFFTHLKSLIDTKDDNETGIVGVEDGSVRVFKCPESQWLTHKANGRADKLADKVLFIDDINGISLKDCVYNEYGISYGPIDQRHFAIIVDEKYHWRVEKYAEFQSKLKQLVNDAEVTSVDAIPRIKEAKRNMKDNKPFAALGILCPLANIPTAIIYAKDMEEVKKNEKALRSQMLYYAINKVYFEELDHFMKS